MGRPTQDGLHHPVWTVGVLTDAIWFDKQRGNIYAYDADGVSGRHLPDCIGVPRRHHGILTDKSEHIDRLRTVFQRLRDYNLKVKVSKHELFKRSIKFLGHQVSAKGISTDPDRVAAVKSWPTPTTVQELRSYL